MGYPARKLSNTQFKYKKEKWKNNSSIHLVSNKTKPRYFTYIVRVDGGLAPNPFYNFCTLALCKPRIRKSARPGDWIIGLYSQAKKVSSDYRGKLVYIMQVTEKMTLDEYWKNKKFLRKRQNANSAKGKCGDNMYYKNSKGNWVQKTYEAHDSPENRKSDTSVDAVLISKKFFYFGKKCIDLPRFFQQSVSSKLTQGHRYKGLENEGKKLIKLLEKRYGRGRHGDPIDYKEDSKRCSVKTSRIGCRVKVLTGLCD